jgi:hypothetical protein
MFQCLSFYRKAFKHADEYSWNQYIRHYATVDAKH